MLFLLCIQSNNMYSLTEKMNITPGTTNSFLRDYERRRPYFEVDSFSWLVKAEIETYTSAVFESGGYKWKLVLYPNGKGTKEATAEDYISLYLSIEGTESWPPHWEVKVDVKLLVYNHIKKEYVTIKDCGEPMKRFNELEKEWGFSELFDLKTFMDETNGFLFNDCCVFAAEVFQELDGYSRAKCFPIKGYNIQNGTLRMVRELGPAHFLFPIKSFSAIDQQNSESHESDIFEAGGFKWRLSLYPNGNKKANVKDHISLYLRIEDTSPLDPNWEVYATLKFFVYDHINKNYLTVEDSDGTLRRFDKLKKEWGLDRLILLKDFKYISNGFILADCSCTFGVEVFVVKQQGKKTVLPPLVQGTLQVYTWILDNFSSIGYAIASERFLMGGTEWHLTLFPRGISPATSSMSMYIDMDSTPSTERDVTYRFVVVDQINNKNQYEMAGRCKFTSFITYVDGFRDFLPLERLNDPSSGFLRNNTVIVQAIFTSISG